VQTAIQEPPKPAVDALAKASDAETKQALAAERRKADRRKRAERRKREFRRMEQQNQVAERTREEPSFAQPARISVLPAD
jgi:hypothetical protein